MAKNDLGSFYRNMKTLGIHMYGKTNMSMEPNSMETIVKTLEAQGNEQFEGDPAITDFGLPPRPTKPELNKLPSEEEILEHLALLKESAPGLDEVTALMLKEAGEEFHLLLVPLVQKLWAQDPALWEHSLCEVVGFRLYKKGARDDVNNYRTTWLIDDD